MSLAAATGFGALNGYFGQAGSEPLRTYCDSGIDSVTIAFVNQSPENDDSGYPGTNFGGHCWAGTYVGENGEDSNLLSNCVYIQGDIGYCQERGVKVLLSIGGVYDPILSDYEVSTDANGEEFAEFLYKAFGPYDPDWDGPRPFDTETDKSGVDGFDFDIEKDFDNKPYIAMIEKFRSLDNSLFITGAPQCPTSSQYFYMKEMIQKAAFDALFIQFYNNVGCDTIEGNSVDPDEGFNFADWEGVVANSDKSETAKLYVGLPASPLAAGSGYVPASYLQDIVCSLKDRPNFGGISLWDLSRGAINFSGGKDYNTHALEALQYGCDPIPTTTSTTAALTTTSSSSSTRTSTPTTTNSSSSSSSTSAVTSTGKSTTPAPTSTSTRTSSSSSSSSTTPAPTTKVSTSTQWANSTTVSSTSSHQGATTTSNTARQPTTTLTSSSHWSFPTHGWNTTTTTPATTAPGITTSSARLTTSTVFTTSVHTVTRCPPQITDCPVGSVTTETIPAYTTVCPVTEEQPAPTAPTTEAPGAWTTSTAYTTSEHTVTACPPEIPDCPVGSVTTQTMPAYTTVCPLTQTEDVPQPEPTSPGEQVPPAEEDSSSAPAKPTGPAAPGEEAPPAGRSTVVITGGPTAVKPSTVSAPPKPTGEGCSGPGCPGGPSVPVAPGAANPTESWTGKPPASSPTVPPTGGAPALTVGLAGVVAMVAAQVLAL